MNQNLAVGLSASVLGLVVIAALAGLIATACPGVRSSPGGTKLDSVHVAFYRDSTAECRVVSHQDVGLAVSCWPRRAP